MNMCSKIVFTHYKFFCPIFHLGLLEDFTAAIKITYQFIVKPSSHLI